MGFNSTLKFSNPHSIPGLSKLPCTIPWFRAVADSVWLIGRDQILSASRTNLSVMQNPEIWYEEVK